MTEQTPSLRDRPRKSFPFQVGEPVEHRGVVVAPLFPLRDPVAGYVTLDEAIGKGLEIAETGPDGTVPELTVTNPLDEAVLLYDGEELVGAKQNRILDVSVLVAAGSKLTIPVSCVEQGRWRSVSRTFSAAPHVSSTDLRRAKAAALASRGTRSRRRAGRGLAIRPDEAPFPRRRLRHRCKPRCVRRPRAPDRGTRERVRGRPGPVRRRTRDRRRAVPGRRLTARGIRGPVAQAPCRLPARRARPPGRAADAPRAHAHVRRRGRRGCAQPPAVHGPGHRPAATRAGARLRLELDDELIQLSAFTADQDRSARAVGGRIVRPRGAGAEAGGARPAGWAAVPAGRSLHTRPVAGRVLAIGGFSLGTDFDDLILELAGARASVPTAQGIISIRVLMLIGRPEGEEALAARTLRDRFAAPPSRRGRRAR